MNVSKTSIRSEESPCAGRKKLESIPTLLKLGARYYDPTLGRFTQTDPAAQGPNPYSYAGDDPTNFIDPTGQAWLGDLIGFGLATAGLAVAIVGVFISTPLVIGIGLGVAAASFLVGGDIIACDLNHGIACGVF
jgi:RHS repeat-associated protein